MSPLRRGGVAQPHGGTHDKVRQGGDRAQCRLLRSNPVRAWLRGVVCFSRDGVETQCQLMVDGAVGVEENVRRVAIDTGEPR
jgi:hypothetical protein